MLHQPAVDTSETLPPGDQTEAASLDLVATQLAALIGLVDSLPARLAAAIAQQDRGGRAISAADRRFLAAALPLIDATVGNAAWQLRDLATEHPRVFAQVAALAGGGAAPARHLGKRLGRCKGTTVDGRQIQHIGSQRDGALWKVERVC